MDDDNGKGLTQRICTINKALIEECQKKLKLHFESEEVKSLHGLRKDFFVFKPTGQKAEEEKKEENWRERYRVLDEVLGLLKDRIPTRFDDLYNIIKQGKYVQTALVREEIKNVADITFYLERDLDQMEGLAEKVTGDPVVSLFLADTPSKLKLKEDGQPSQESSRDLKLWLWDGREIAATGRASFCYSNRQRQWSITFRKEKLFAPPTDPPEFLNDQQEIYNVIYEVIFGKGKEAEDSHGLVVITGRTGSMKSEVARGLIEKYLRNLIALKKEDERRPHLLTFEDPVEKPFTVVGVDYTPREREKDVHHLDEAISNALRQTPAVMFVGETRRPEDWDKLLHFAGTGHLVVTTAHAGSLSEAMENILQAANAYTPMARSVVASRMLALIHLQPSKVRLSENQESLPILIPALWHRTPNGIKALMAEGLSSLLPNVPRNMNDARFCSSIGRYWFANRLVEPSNNRNQQKWSTEKRNEVRQKVKSKALNFDLQGI